MEYRVTWEIDVDAEGPDQAAWAALECQSAESTANGSRRGGVMKKSTKKEPAVPKTPADYEGRLVAIRISDGQIVGGIVFDGVEEAGFTTPQTIVEALNSIPAYQAAETAIYELVLVRHLRPRQIPARTEWDEVTKTDGDVP